MKVLDEYCPFDICRDQSVFELVDSYIDSKFGSLHVVHTRDSSADTCTVFLHGVGATWADWTPMLLQAKAEGLDLGPIILFDIPGFGESENLTDHLNIEVVGDAIVDAANLLGYKQFRLVGHSMGGFLALDMASRNHPEIVSLHIAAGAYFSIVRTVQAPIKNLLRSPVVSLLYGSLTLLAALGPVGRKLTQFAAPSPIIDLVLRPFARHPSKLKDGIRRSIVGDPRPESFLRAAANGVAYDARARWSQIRVPVTGAFGRYDHLVPPDDMDELLLSLPMARLRLIDNAAHLVHIEQPAETLSILLDESGS